MKFANISMQRNGLNNLGDNMQLLAIDNLYNYIGIDRNEIVRIDFYDLNTYSGEYVLLPINYPFYGYKDDMSITMFSPKIIPVFLGLSLMCADFKEAELDYLKRFEPIGCRDEYTMTELRKRGIFAYLNGCLTAVFPKVRSEDSNHLKKIFCVDVNQALRKYIPSNLLPDCEFISQMVYDTPNAGECAKNYYDRYINEARLIITTRLHCAVPCMAAGIPVVLLKENYSFRFPWLNKLLPVYTDKLLEEIDWTPQPIEYEDIKIKILENAKNRILNVKKSYEQLLDISSFFEKDINAEQGDVEHYSTAKRYILNNWKSDIKIEYSFWGITQPARLIYEFIQKYYPGATLKFVYDKYKRVDFCGVRSKAATEIEQDKDTFIFVTSASAFVEAEEYFKKLGKENYLQCSSDNIL